MLEILWETIEDFLKLELQMIVFFLVGLSFSAIWIYNTHIIHKYIKINILQVGLKKCRDYWIKNFFCKTPFRTVDQESIFCKYFLLESASQEMFRCYLFGSLQYLKRSFLFRFIILFKKKEKKKKKIIFYFFIFWSVLFGI